MFLVWWLSWYLKWWDFILLANVHRHAGLSQLKILVYAWVRECVADNVNKEAFIVANIGSISQSNHAFIPIKNRLLYVKNLLGSKGWKLFLSWKWLMYINDRNLRMMWQ